MTSILTIIQQQDEEYDRLHALYHEAKQLVDSATTPEELEAATTTFKPIQQAFLRNRERATPTECYQIIASFLDRKSRARLAQCDRHQHYQVIYGKYSGVFVWSVGGLLERRYRRTYKKDPKTPTMTPLLHASREGTSRVVHVLIDAKANLEAVDHDGNRRTPLHWACEGGHEEVAGLLIDAGADVNANASGFTALHSTAENDSMNVMPILIAAGANINQTDHYGDTPLALACFENHTDAAIALLTANADPNIVSKYGVSPLMWASQEGNMNVVRALLAANANVQLVSNQGYTALKSAKRDNHKEVIALLRASGAIDQ